MWRATIFMDEMTLHRDFVTDDSTYFKISAYSLAKEFAKDAIAFGFGIGLQYYPARRINLIELEEIDGKDE